jgi:hypothetical protein
MLFGEGLRLEPKPRFLRREFIKSINPREEGKGSALQVGQPFFKTREALEGSGLVEACKRPGVRLSTNYLAGVAFPPRLA